MPTRLNRKNEKQRVWSRAQGKGIVCELGPGDEQAACCGRTV